MGGKGIEPTPCNLTSTGQTTKPPIPINKYSHLFTFVLFPADIYLGKTRRPSPHRAPGSLTPSPFPHHAPGADAAGSSPTPFPTRLLEPDAAGRRLPPPAGSHAAGSSSTPPYGLDASWLQLQAAGLHGHNVGNAPRSPVPPVGGLCRQYPNANGSCPPPPPGA